MALTLMEGTIDAVESYLNTNMAAKLDTLDSEYNDGITLDDIQTYYKAETLAVPELPSIYVIGNRTVPEAEGPTYLKAAHYMTIAVMVGDANTETLRKRLYRHIRAIVEVLRAARDDATFVSKAVVFDTFEFSPMYGRTGAFLQDARVECHISTVETE